MIRKFCRFASGRNNNKLRGSTTYIGEECYNLLPVQYTTMMHKLWTFQVYTFLDNKYPVYSLYECFRLDSLTTILQLGPNDLDISVVICDITNIFVTMYCTYVLCICTLFTLSVLSPYVIYLTMSTVPQKTVKGSMLTHIWTLVVPSCGKFTNYIMGGGLQIDGKSLPVLICPHWKTDAPTRILMNICIWYFPPFPPSPAMPLQNWFRRERMKTAEEIFYPPRQIKSLRLRT